MRVGLVSGLALLTIFLASPAWADSDDDAFLTGLRHRRLFRLAETYCQEQLSKDDLPDPRRGELVIELSRTLATHAIDSPLTPPPSRLTPHASPPAESDKLWQQAADTATAYAARFPPGDARGVLARVQKALVVLAHGELLRRQAEVSTDSEPWFEEARKQLRQAIQELIALAAEVAALQRPGAAGRLPAGSPSPQELFALGTNLDYQISRAYRNQGHSYPPDSPDRTDALLEATKRLALLAQRPVEEPLAWQSRLDEISSFRLLKNFPKAHQRLEQLDKLQPPPGVALDARAERIHLALDAELLTDALELLALPRTIAGQASPELDFACLEVLLEAGKAAKNNAAQASLRQQQASQLVELIARVHGPYWARRAETLEARFVTGSSAMSGDLAAMIRAGENFYRGSQFAESLKAYDAARQLALKGRQADKAFELGFTAAAIEYRQRHWSESAARFLELARKSPDHPQARRAHLAAIGAVLDAAKATEPLVLKPYVELLEEHLRSWPSGPSVGEVQWRLGEVHERERNWVEAANHYAAIPADQEQFPLGITALTRCYEAHLAGLQSKGEGKAAAEQAGKAAEWFTGIVTGPRNAWPEKWSGSQREAALAAAKFWMVDGLERYDLAEQLLAAALKDPGDAPAAWQAAAGSQWVLALAGQNRTEESLKVIDRIAGDNPDAMLSMLQGLSQLAARSTPKRRQELAAVELRAVEMLEPRRARLTPPQVKLLDLTRARGLASAGRAAEARTAYDSLAKASPNDGQIQEEFATLLLDSTAADSLKSAHEKWREVERRSAPGSPRWFRARYSQALAMIRLGKKDQAAQLIQITRTLHPSLGGPELKAQFEKLLSAP